MSSWPHSLVMFQLCSRAPTDLSPEETISDSRVPTRYYFLGGDVTNKSIAASDIFVELSHILHGEPSRAPHQIVCVIVCQISINVDGCVKYWAGRGLEETLSDQPSNRSSVLPAVNPERYVDDTLTISELSAQSVVFLILDTTMTAD